MHVWVHVYCHLRFPNIINLLMVVLTADGVIVCEFEVTGIEDNFFQEKKLVSLVDRLNEVDLHRTNQNRIPRSLYENLAHC